jgi:hypothetical protein
MQKQPKLIWLAIISEANVTQKITVFKSETNGEETEPVLLEEKKMLKTNIITKFKKRLVMRELAVSWTARQKKILNHINGLPLCTPGPNNDVSLPGIRTSFKTSNTLTNVLRGKLKTVKTQVFIYLLAKKVKC